MRIIFVRWREMASTALRGKVIALEASLGNSQARTRPAVRARAGGRVHSGEHRRPAQEREEMARAQLAAHRTDSQVQHAAMLIERRPKRAVREG